MDQGPQPGVGKLPEGKDHTGEEDGHHNDHKEEAGAAAGVVLGLGADVLHGQLQALFVAENGLVLRPMVGKDPVDALGLGAEDEIAQEDDHPDHALHQVPDPEGHLGEEIHHRPGEEGG